MSIDLTPSQRRAVIDGDWPRIPLTPEQAKSVEPHELVVIRHQVWLIVRGAKRDKKAGWYLDYIGRDDRPRLLRQSPHAVDYAAIRRSYDSAGVPRKVNEQDGEQAEEESHYTAVHHLAVPEIVGEPFEAVPSEYQNVLTMRARTRVAEHAEKEQALELAKRDLRSVTAQIRETAITMAKNGIDPQPWLRDLQRQVNDQREQTRAA